MSPAAALDSPAFLAYLLLAGGLLAAAPAALAALGWGLRRDVAHAWAAYRGWLLVVPPLLLVYFLGREAIIVLVTAVALLGFREYARATRLSDDRLLTGAVYLAVAATGAACWLPDPADGRPGWYGLFMALPVFATAALQAVPVLRNRAAGQARPVAAAVVGFVYFGWMFCHLAFLANAPGAYGCLGYLVLAVAVNDVAAYGCGKLLGRRPLRSQISPNKTWGGAAGALAVSALLPWALWFTVPHFDARDCALVGLLVGVGGPLGDLVVSALKRDAGLKDMGRAIPGHGGLLDRVDSLIYTAPLFFHYVHYRHGLAPPA